VAFGVAVPITGPSPALIPVSAMGKA
jgi:hypothetical protein